MTERPGCVETRPLIPELAADVAFPDDRARALRHFADCGSCQRELESQTAVIDELLLLVRDREPPAGFEAAVLEPLSRGEPDRVGARRRRLARTALAWVASVVLVAGLASGATWRQSEDDRRLADSYRGTLKVAGGRYLRAAPVAVGTAPTGAGHVAGYVFAYQGSPSWLFVSMTRARVPGTYQMSITTRSGGQITLGTMLVKDEKGSWGATIPIAVRDVLHVRFRDPAGRDLVARFG
jgi:hypothetical protein